MTETITRGQYDEVSEKIYDFVYEKGGECDSEDLRGVVNSVLGTLGLEMEK